MFVFNQNIFSEEISITTGDFPPYVASNLKGYGPHAQAIRKVFEGSKYKVTFEIQPWNRAYEEVKSGHKAASFPWLKTDERQNDLYYPNVPLQVFNDTAVYRKSRFPNGFHARSLEELVKQKLRIVGIEPYWYVSELRKLGADLTIAPNAKSAYAMLKGDRADLYINVDQVMQMELKEFYPDRVERSKFEISKIPLSVALAYLAFSKNDPRHKDLAKEWDKRATPVLKKMGLLK